MQEERLQGEISRVVFTSEDSGFTVLRIDVRGRRDPVVAVGRMPGVREGETIQVRGTWTTDPKFGAQLRVDSFETVLPQTEEGIRSYLASGMIHGIGPKLAARIVATFGGRTLDVLDEHPQRISEVPGIGKKKVASLTAAWKKQSEVRTIMVFLQGNGVSPAYAARIYKRYESGAARVVQENPYRLADEVVGIGFKKADEIARRNGTALDSPQRMDAGVRFVLSEAASDGHCYLPGDELARRAREALGEPGTPEAVRDAVARLLAGAEIEREDDAVMLGSLARAERESAKRLRVLLDAPARTEKPLDAEKALAWVEERTRLRLAPEQRDAVAKAAGGKVLVITGGPGTGKTSVVDAICKVVIARRERVALAAPTGRAAKRLSEATGLEAKTIHRLLEFDPKSGQFVRNALNPLAADVVILDECSMVDVVLFRAVIDAVPRGARLVMVGDADQLPSVGPGNVLRDVIASRKVPVVRLRVIFRQDARSGIVENAHRVNAGEMPVEYPDFRIIEREEPEAAIATVQTLVAERLRPIFDPMRDVQVLVPMNRGAVGAATLNAALQERLNPRGREVPAGVRKFRIGDRVLQMRNDYEKEVFNGDLGRVRDWDADSGALHVEIDGRIVEYAAADTHELALAYATTIHRSQGSEYPAVVIPFLTQHFVMLQRNLLYTAITRGKRMVAIVGSKWAIKKAVENASGGARWTRLSERL